MAENQAGIDIVAHLDNFRSELAKIPDIGADEARKLTTALSKEIKQAEKAAKDAAKASKEQADATRRAGQAAKDAAGDVARLGDAAGGVGSNVGKLAGALDLVVPGAGAAAQAVADLADVGEVGALATEALGLSLGSLLGLLAPVAAGAGLVAYGYQQDQERAEQAAEETERYNEALRGLTDALSSLATAQGDLETRAGLLTGEFSAQDQAYEAAAKSADQLTRAQREQAQEELSALLARREAIKGMERDRGMLDSFFGPSAGDLARETQTVSARIAELDAKLSTLDQTEAKLIDTSMQVTEGETAAKKATEGRAKAVKHAADAAREHAEAMAVEQARLNAYQQAMEGLASLTAAAAQDTGKLAKMEADRAAQLTRLTDLEQQAVEQAMGNSAALEELDAASAAARKAIWADYYADVQTYHDELVKKATDDAEKVAQHEAEVAAKVAASAVNSATSTMDAIDQIAQTIQARAEEQGAQQAQLAQVAFGVHKGAAIASAGVTTAKMALDAYAAALELGAPGLILAPIAAGAAVATGAAQVAAIASEPPPKFHAGGTVGPDEVAATLKRGEGVLSGQGMQAAGGAEGVRRLNAGQKPNDGPIVVQLGHKLFEAAARRNARLSGSILSQRARRLGHRSR